MEILEFMYNTHLGKAFDEVQELGKIRRISEMMIFSNGKF